MNLKEKRRALAEGNRNYGQVFSIIPTSDWPSVSGSDRIMFGVWRSRDFVVQGVIENGVKRLSINRTSLDSMGDWKDGITWDQLQHIKNACGFTDCMAVEIYPPQSDLVNVANIRHLWILEQPLPFMWRKATNSNA